MSKTVSGELITIDDSAYDGMDDIVIYGKTVQNLWFNPSGKSISSNPDGSLKISVTNGNGETARVMSYALKPSTKYTASVDKSLGTPTSYALNVGFRDSSGQVIANVYFGQDGSYATKRTFTSPSSFAYALFEVVALADLSGTYRVMLREATEAEIKAAASTPQTLPVYPDDSGPDASNEELGIMPLNDISTLSDTYDDYWCPPGLSSIDNVEIVTAGKNLFNAKEGIGDVSGWVATQLSNAGDGWIKVTVSSGALGINYKSDKFRFLADTTYTLSFEAYATRNVYLTYNYIIRSGLAGNIELSSLGATNPLVTTTKQRVHTTFRTKEELVGNIMVGLAYGFGVDDELYIRNLQLELGSTATAYEPPNITTTPIDLQGHTLNALPDGTRDELHIDGGGNVVLEKRTGTYIANGDEGWELSATSDVPYRMMVVNWSKDVENVTVPINRFQVDRLPKYNLTPTVRSFIVVNGRYQLYAARNGIQDASSFSEWLKSNPMTVIYKFAEPQTVGLGKIDLPKLRKKPLLNNVLANGRAETTNFYLDTEMELTYRQWPGARADGFKVSGKHNFWDFASCIASSDSGKPEKKFVTATVPYMSGFYDLSKIYGAIAYESRDVSYTFELLGDDMDDLQRQKTNLLDWLGLVHDEPIYDDTQPNYHYVGSFYEADWEEDETGESGTLTVTFRCQPFLIADRATEESLSVGTHTVVNNGQQVSVFAKSSSGSATVKINGVIQAVTTTEQRLTAQLQPGENEVVVTSNSVTLRYYERHL